MVLNVEQSIRAICDCIMVALAEFEAITTKPLIPRVYPFKSIDIKEAVCPERLDVPPPPPSNIPKEVLSVDKDTPDYHVPRDSRLIRLTGVHPFNSEAPLTELYNQGFLTSPELFYVRNHGPVPRVQEEDIPKWELRIEGLVENPLVLNFKQILQDFDQFTLPVTLVCAGNRRKEQNQVRKSKGFSWGPAGVSTALFTGPLMSEVIWKAKPFRRAKYVCMEGADKLVRRPDNDFIYDLLTICSPMDSMGHQSS
jgi:nitrate reductase (NAD(P)H)